MIKIRKSDKWGSGAYGARRDGGVRVHNGVDIVAAPNAPVYSLCDALYVRQNRPYISDSSYVGLTMADADGRTIKYFYVMPVIKPGARVRRGELIGHAQEIPKKYSGITNHYHFEVWQDGKTIDPLEYLYATPIL